MKPRIGIPRSLAYYSFFPLWQTFLTNLGLEVVLSPATNKKVMDQGVRETVTDACVPIKLVHGHVLALKEHSDYIFIPRLVCADGSSTFCPKFLGLPDMIRNSIEGLPPIIGPRFNLQRGRRAFFYFFAQAAKPFSKSKLQVLRAGRRAVQALSFYRQQLLCDLAPIMSLAKGHQKKFHISSSGLNIAVLGYPYLVYDPYVSVNMIEKLVDMGVAPKTVEMVAEKDLRQVRHKLPQELFWYYSNRVVWSCLHYLNKRQVDGVIHVTAFGCGPDAMVGKLLELECKHRNMPFITVTLDEHTGEAGIMTRLEAFVDLLKKRWI